MDINSLYPSTYLKSADVKAQPIIATIKNVAPEVIADNETKPVIYFNELDRGMVLNKTNGMMIAAFYGTETSAWTGQQIELYSEPVAFQGRIVDSIRVRRPVAAAAQAVAPVAVSPAAPTDVAAQLKDMDEAQNW